MTTVDLPAPLRRTWLHPVGGPLLRVGLAAAALIVFVEAAFGQHKTVPAGIFLLGMVQGSLYGLMAFGIILIYRANRLISFTQAGLGSVPALFALLLITNHHLPYFAALGLMLVGAAATGILVEVGIMARFRDSPRLVATVATIGIAQVLALTEIGVTHLLTGRAIAPTSFPTPFGGFTFDFGGVRFSGNSIIVIVVVPAVMAGLSFFFRRTRMGIAVRASAENGERAALLGIPVRRVSTVVWVIAALCSGIGIFLRAPIVGLPPGGTVSYDLLLYAMAAAVIARMESLPVALGGGMAIGVIVNSCVYSTSNPEISKAVMLPLILGALLAQRGRLSRAMDTGVATFKTFREYRPVPTELRNLPEVRGALIGAGALAAVFFVTFPYLLGRTNAGFASLVVIYAIVGVSLVLLSGWAGQISLGQFAFAGVGAAVAGGLAATHRTDFFVTLAAAGVAGAVIAVLIGIPALRVQGLFLAVATLAFAATVQSFLLDPKYFGWLLPKGFTEVKRPYLYGRFDVHGDVAFYYVCLGALVLTYLSARSLRASASGRSFISVRDNVRAAQSFGLSAARTKLVAFAVSGFYAAVAGALLAYKTGAVDQTAFPLSMSINVFIFAVIGGLTSLAGAILGAVYFVGLQYFGPKISFFGHHFQYLAVLGTGAGVLWLLRFLPGGLIDAVYRVRDNLLRRVAARRQLLVPSLLADRLADSPHGPAPEENVALTHAEFAVEEAEALAASAGAPAITCPACGAQVPLAEAASHPHFAEATTATTGSVRS